MVKRTAVIGLALPTMLSIEYLPRGKHVIAYVVRLNNPGVFAVPPTRVEAMYSPETFGETPNAALEVKP